LWGRWRRCDAPTVPGAVASSGRENFSEHGRGGSDELGEGHGLPFSLVEGSDGGARPGVDATRVSSSSRSAVELIEACFEAPYGAVDIGELVEAEESDAE